MTSEFGRFHSFQATSSEVPASTSSYRNFDAFVDEGVRAGILGGMHFRSSAEEGTREGAKVAAWVLAHCLLPLGRPQAEITRCSHLDAVAEAATPWPASSPASPFPATRAGPRPSPSRWVSSASSRATRSRPGSADSARSSVNVTFAAPPPRSDTASSARSRQGCGASAVRPSPESAPDSAS